MKLSLVRAGIVASTLAAVTGMLIACSSDDDARSGFEGDADSGNVVLPTVDGGTDANDAGLVDARVDSGPRTCSDDGFCHSVLPKDTNLRAVWGDGTGVVWAFDLKGDILRWDGATWKVHQHIETVAEEDGLFSIFGTGPTDVWIPSDKGLLHGTGTSSATLVFAPVTLPGDNTVPVRAVWGTGPNDLWAVGGSESYEEPYMRSRALHYGGPSGDGGTGWTVDAQLSAMPVAIKGIWGSAGSGPWVHGSEPDPFGSPSGVVVRRAAGTTTWKRVAQPADPAEPFHPNAQYFLGGTLATDSAVLLCGVAGNFDSAYWHGTQTADGGTSFVLDKQGFWQRPCTALLGFAPNDVWSVGQSGLVAHWNGTTWKPAAIRVTDVPYVGVFWGIWGTSTDDFWLVGDEIALHKTTAGKP